MRKESIVQQCRKIIDMIRYHALTRKSIEGRTVSDAILTRSIMDALGYHDKRTIRHWKDLLQEYEYVKPMNSISRIVWMIHDYLDTGNISRIEDWNQATTKEEKKISQISTSASLEKNLAYLHILAEASRNKKTKIQEEATS